MNLLSSLNTAACSWVHSPKTENKLLKRTLSPSWLGSLHHTQPFLLPGWHVSLSALRRRGDGQLENRKLRSSDSCPNDSQLGSSLWCQNLKNPFLRRRHPSRRRWRALPGSFGFYSVHMAASIPHPGTLSSSFVPYWGFTVRKMKGVTRVTMEKGPGDNRCNMVRKCNIVYAGLSCQRKQVTIGPGNGRGPSPGGMAEFSRKLYSLSPRAVRSFPRGGKGRREFLMNQYRQT